MGFGVYTKRLLLEGGISKWMPEGKDLTSYPGKRREAIRFKVENASDKEKGREIRNITILLKEVPCVEKNRKIQSQIARETHTGFLGTGIFENILKHNCSFS